MLGRCKLTVAAVLAFAAPAAAAPVTFTVSGLLDHVEYDYLGPISQQFFAVAPLGSPYQFTFSYDTDAVPLYANPSGASYEGAATGSFAVGGASFALEPSAIAVGGGPLQGTRFGIFGNFGPTQPQDRPNGFYAVDLALSLADSTGHAVAGPLLPTTLSLSAFDNRQVRVRFANGQGETGLIFSVTGISGGSQMTVPEPATWGMMILGFGAIGGIMRRRGRKPAFG